MPPKPNMQEELARLAAEATVAEELELKRREEMELKRQEEEAQRQEELRIAREEELKRLADQNFADAPINAEKERLMERIREDARDLAAWDKYLECSPLPNVQDGRELSTFLSMLKEHIVSVESNPVKHLKTVLQSAEDAEHVIETLDDVYGLAKETLDADKMESFGTFIENVRAFTQQKLDNMTAGFLQRCDGSGDVDKESKTVCYSSGHTRIGYGLWIHLKMQKKIMVKKIDLSKDLGVVIDLPMALQNCRTSIRIMRVNYDNLLERSTTKPVERQLAREAARVVSVGGVIDVDQLALPQFPTHWTNVGPFMRELTSLTETLVRVPYPPEENASSAQGPAKIWFTLPQTLVLRDKYPRFGMWDFKTMSWIMDGVTLLRYDAETRKCCVQLPSLKPLSVIQPRCLDFPYRQWSVGPQGHNKVVVKVQGSRFVCEFEVSSSFVRLKMPNLPNIQHLYGKPLQPGYLLFQLQRCGVLLMPSDEDGIYARKTMRGQDLERRANKMIGSVCTGCFVTGSPWNATGTADQVFFSLQMAPPTERGSKLSLEAIALAQKRAQEAEEARAAVAAAEGAAADADKKADNGEVYEEGQMDATASTESGVTKEIEESKAKSAADAAEGVNEGSGQDKEVFGDDNEKENGEEGEGDEKRRDEDEQNDDDQEFVNGIVIDEGAVSADLEYVRVTKETDEMELAEALEKKEKIAEEKRQLQEARDLAIQEGRDPPPLPPPPPPPETMKVIGPDGTEIEVPLPKEIPALTRQRTMHILVTDEKVTVTHSNEEEGTEETQPELITHVSLRRAVINAFDSVGKVEEEREKEAAIAAARTVVQAAEANGDGAAIAAAAAQLSVAMAANNPEEDIEVEVEEAEEEVEEDEEEEVKQKRIAAKKNRLAVAKAAKLKELMSNPCWGMSRAGAEMSEEFAAADQEAAVMETQDTVGRLLNLLRVFSFS